jgi:hypothetical protein
VHTNAQNSYTKNQIQTKRKHNDEQNKALSDANSNNDKLATTLNEARMEHSRNTDEHSASMTSMRTLVKVCVPVLSYM